MSNNADLYYINTSNKATAVDFPWSMLGTLWGEQEPQIVVLQAVFDGLDAIKKAP